MRVWGVSALSHDAAVAVVDGDRIVFAAHAERYSRRKNDALLNQEIIDDAAAYGEPDTIVWYERPWLKKSRQLWAGQVGRAFDLSMQPRRYLGGFAIPGRPRFVTVEHHRSHAAAGFFVSGFDEACVVTADGIGEWVCTTTGVFRNGTYRRLRTTRYPNSLGLLYSAFTKRCGFRPNDEEYIVMGLAALGVPRHVGEIYRDLVVNLEGDFRLKRNVHRGIGGWLPDARPQDLAASIQAVTEDIMVATCRRARETTGSQKLVLMGGVALNCVANSRIALECGFDDVFILPNPGDAGSSLGAAAAHIGRPLRWDGPFLGTEICRPYPVREALQALLAGRVVGVASGRAEFGPRALGNRSLLCDPRGRWVKDRVNAIKGREPFRPFAPVILEQHAASHFAMPIPRSPYMQFVAQCFDPSSTPAITHVDGTSRVQTLRSTDNPGLHELLTAFHNETGCPMLLNTSLNVRGEPPCEQLDGRPALRCRVRR